MKKLSILVVLFFLFSSHDMYLKMGSYYLQPDTPASILLYNGTFEKSDNIISRDRMKDASLVGNGIRSQIDTTSWADEGNTTVLNFSTGKAGTWVAGVSTRARNIEMEADAFNDYLEHDGVLDMLERRKQTNTLDSNAVEQYAKHVKVIFQVGNEKTEDWAATLGYPVEFVPLSNPYSAEVGDKLQVKLMKNGQSLARQLVYVGNVSESHSHDKSSDVADEHTHTAEEEDHHHHPTTKLRTDDKGIITIALDKVGEWYLRTIYMQESEEAGLTHVSNWATLTFEISGDQAHAEHGHQHSDGTFHTHEHTPHGSYRYFYWLGGIALLAGIFLWVRYKR